MKHPEKRTARSIDMQGRSRKFTDMVYSGVQPDPKAYWQAINRTQNEFDPPAPEYSLYCGEMHGHTNISDAYDYVEIDGYFRSIRDKAKFDFGALSDHDHGGVGRAELWKEGKWERIKSKVREYYEPGKFTTLLAYERDSYPYFNNLVIYYRSDDGELVRGVRDGEITYSELTDLLRRDDDHVIPPQ